MRFLPRLLLLLPLAHLLAGATPAGAVPLSVDVWYESYVTGVGQFGTACSGAICVPGTGTVFVGDPPWTFTTPVGGQSLLVTDAFDYGDIFEVFDFGVSLGTTSAVVPTAGNCGGNPDACFANPLSSSRAFFMAAGDHSITIQLDQEFIGNSGGAFFLRVSSEVVPEPSLAALAGLAALPLGACLRRRMRGRDCR